MRATQHPQSDYYTPRLWSTTDVIREAGNLGIRLELDVHKFKFTFHDPNSMRAFYSNSILEAIAYIKGYEHAMLRVDTVIGGFTNANASTV